MKSLVHMEELCSRSVPLEHAPGAKPLVCIGLWSLFATQFSYKIHHFHIDHNAPCLHPKIWHKHRLLLGRLYHPGEIENNCYPKFFWGDGGSGGRGGGGVNKVHYDLCENGELRKT